VAFELVLHVHPLPHEDVDVLDRLFQIVHRFSIGPSGAGLESRGGQRAPSEAAGKLSRRP
jgi:hypothetical protein